MVSDASHKQIISISSLDSVDGKDPIADATDPTSITYAPKGIVDDDTTPNTLDGDGTTPKNLVSDSAAPKNLVSDGAAPRDASVALASASTLVDLESKYKPKNAVSSAHYTSSFSEVSNTPQNGSTAKDDVSGLTPHTDTPPQLSNQTSEPMAAITPSASEEVRMVFYVVI